MASFHHDGDKVRVLIKGAPDVILARSNRYLDASVEVILDSVTRANFVTESARLADQAMRVLAVASREIRI